MKRAVLILGGVGLLALVAGCQATETTSSEPEKPKLLLPINSSQRLMQCAKDWGGPKTKEFAECWRGEKYTSIEFCAYAGNFLNEPFASDWQKAAVYEKMRNYGCMN